jgi:hypothetical protein
MPLYAYNLKGTVQVIPVISKPVPASAGPPARSVPVNVTSEFRHLSQASFALIDQKRADGTFEFEWSGTQEYLTPGLIVLNPAVESGTESLGSLGNPMRIDPVGLTAQPTYEIARPGTDTYVVTAAIDLEGSAGLEESILYLWAPAISFHGAELLWVDVQVAGDRLGDGKYELQFRRMIAEDFQPGGDPLTPTPTIVGLAPSEMICRTGSDLQEVDPEIILRMPFAGHQNARERIIISPPGTNFTLNPRLGQGIDVRAVILNDMSDPVRVVVSFVYLEIVNLPLTV